MPEEQEQIKPNQKKDDAKVTLLGREVGSRDSWGRDDRGGGGLLWGILLIFAGAMLFLNSTGVVPWEVWERLWQFWPLLLILMGLHIILGNSLPARFILTVLSVAVFTFVVLAALNQVTPSLVPALPEDINRGLKFWEDFQR